MLDVAEYSSASECRFSDIRTTWRRKKCKNKARFSDEQIRSLEVTFENETKLEPRKKALLAKELGLQPRQVAIWFQNKRARWKSKQMEKEYGILLASYNTLASQLECLKKERQSLLVQLQSLKNEMEKSADKSLGETQENAANSSRNVESDNTKKNEFKPKDNNNISTRRVVGMLVGDDDVSVKSEYMALHDEELLKLVESHNESPLTSSDDWGTSLDSDDHQWWDFWC